MVNNWSWLPPLARSHHGKYLELATASGEVPPWQITGAGYRRWRGPTMANNWSWLPPLARSHHGKLLELATATGEVPQWQNTGSCR